MDSALEVGSGQGGAPAGDATPARRRTRPAGGPGGAGASAAGQLNLLNLRLSLLGREFTDDDHQLLLRLDELEAGGWRGGGDEPAALLLPPIHNCRSLLNFIEKFCFQSSCTAVVLVRCWHDCAPCRRAAAAAGASRGSSRVPAGAAAGARAPLTLQAGCSASSSGLQQAAGGRGQWVQAQQQLCQQQHGQSGLSGCSWTGALAAGPASPLCPGAVRGATAAAEGAAWAPAATPAAAFPCGARPEGSGRSSSPCRRPQLQ